MQIWKLDQKKPKIPPLALWPPHSLRRPCPSSSPCTNSLSDGRWVACITAESSVSAAYAMPHSGICSLSPSFGTYFALLASVCMPSKHRQYEGCWAASLTRPTGKHWHQHLGSSVPYSGWQSSDRCDTSLQCIKAKGPSAAEAKCTAQTKF